MTGASKLFLSALFPLTLLSPSAHESPLVKIYETSIDISAVHGITANNCISVQPDGNFHLEVRVQQLPSPTVTLHIYEATLNDFQMDRLHNLLDAQSLRESETFQSPKLPVSAPTFQVAVVQITREDSMQKLGYFAWNERVGKENERPESEPAAVKEQWLRSRVLLAPLLAWSHELRLMKMRELPESASTLCDADSLPE
jgi:hypothetical protein